ncbi:hypothetical protein CNE_1c13510 [Cupriavidus necator N-1]|uniref:Uncharacterized protein n=1 Tax=Cupriavidus necator (strain ATCC 43291 / DSM 13513 / CCUG 52238 / LMG 8453 / N-1) TaxID=1042878 RepID=G0ES82_CUPNN|nr:hypothetical protein [Cupriavidus necator]AEI76700.1 hypothetical protein CNE_1c13510 [Cupriavidus necator N-1]MDX6014726.1 hypothetical protein [Cupriavidus necator]
MSWPIGTTVSMATRRLDSDIVDLARDSTALKRDNAELRRQLMAAQRAAEHAEEALAISREAHAVMTLQIAQLEKLARELIRGAEQQPHWPLARWVKFGPMATLLTSIKDQA